MAGAGGNTDRFVYGVALVIALIAGGIAVVSNSSEEDVPDTTASGDPDPVAAARERAEAEERRTTIVLDSADAGARPPASRVGPDFVPDLPTVPDLETEPPPERPEPDDPRMTTLAAEMRILSRARTLLGEHPSEAIGVIDQHRRQYPHGVLREERESFAIEALLALEHADEAERRYYDFLRDFPDSEHREHLQRAMQRPPHRVGAGGR